MPHHILTVGLANGDEGKGTVTDALVRHHSAKLVVRYSGGAQCGHNVVTPEGVHHCFSQFGAGTLAGAHTLLDKHVIVDPIKLVNEGLVLEEKGVTRPFDRLNVHEDCLIITPYHRALNQLKELVRSQQPGLTSGRHGSCGLGIGETAAHALKHPTHAVRFRDLGHRAIQQKLEQVQADLQDEADLTHDLLTSQSTTQIEETHQVFNNPHVTDAYAWRFQEVSKIARMIYEDQACLLIRRSSTVFEGAQGVLLDEDYGFHPYTTWSRVTLRNAVDRMESCGIKDYETLGVLRAYATRHGPGPFPTETKLGLEEPHNLTNEWQRDFRVGHFDAKLSRYATQVAGRLDGLAITHLGSLLDMWHAAVDYPVNVSPLPVDDFQARERLTKQLMEVRPEQITYESIDACQSEKSTCDMISGYLGLPVVFTSSGPQYQDKTILGEPVVDRDL